MGKHPYRVFLPPKTPNNGWPLGPGGLRRPFKLEGRKRREREGLPVPHTPSRAKQREREEVANETDERATE